jgi:hypothetical protein
VNANSGGGREVVVFANAAVNANMSEQGRGGRRTHHHECKCEHDMRGGKRGRGGCKKGHKCEHDTQERGKREGEGEGHKAVN